MHSRVLRRLDGQQVNRQTYLKFYDMICLAIIYYLVLKIPYILPLLNWGIFLNFNLEHSSKRAQWQRPMSPLNSKLSQN